jgi:hypothetical protein
VGPRPAEVVDRLRELELPALVGNTDQIMWEPALREEQECRAPRLRRGWTCCSACSVHGLPSSWAMTS